MRPRLCYRGRIVELLLALRIEKKPVFAALACAILVIPTALAESQSVVTSDSPVPISLRSGNSHKELLAGPAKPEDFVGWLVSMRVLRRTNQEQIRTRLGDLPDPYSLPALQWAQRSFIQPQMMAHERFFYDPMSRRYTVNRYLDDLQNRYGGIDSVLVWPTYPNIGVDNRNQFDLWRAMHGGTQGLRRMVDDFHKRGVRVLFPIMYWDHGTRDEGVPMAQSLAKLLKETGADGLNGDTMSPITLEFYTEPLKVGHPLALEPENGLADEMSALGWNVLSWGYWGSYQPVPAVDRYKFIEPRHLTHVCERWAHNRTDMLQYAFFNGDGYESWENVWGIWNQVTPRDAAALRRISAIYRAVPELLSSSDYEPFSPTLRAGVFATKFPGPNATLWTLINRNDSPDNGPQISVPTQAGLRFFDLWQGKELKPESDGDNAILSFEMEAHGYGAVLAATSLPPHVNELLKQTRSFAAVKLGDLSSTWTILPQQMVTMIPTPKVSAAPDGMVLVPAGRFKFKAEGVMIERSEGVDVQYPWEDKPVLKHEHELALKGYYIDRYPVTCGQFKAFLDATHYHPKDDYNFLRDWKKNGFPEGWAKKPVTWVSLDDARAYAKWAGKRLPHEWEWQYAAQGSDGRRFPWGNDEESQRVPPFETGRNQRPSTDVDAYPQGGSPFGVLDLVGNVWQWTDEFIDDHTRAAVLKGGSYYRPDKSMWYFPQARQLTQHGKYLLLAPSIDRSATIGFRCVKDAE